MTDIITDDNGISFLIGDYIDKGSFSKVYTLECCLSKQQFAGKFVSKAKLQKYGIGDKVWDEILIHQKLRHENIVQFITSIQQQNHIVIVLEYCSKESMINILYALKTLTASESKYFMTQIVSAVEYLHKNRIVHRDLKLGNLFVDRQLRIKLGDFGLAVVIEYEGQKRFSRCGTPNYIAPEVISGVGHSYEVDIWALGCILHTMLEGTPPFQGQNTTSTYNNILKCQYTLSPHIDDLARTFITSILQTDPKHRPTIFELLNFEFLTSSEVVPKAPQFIMGEDQRMSLFSKSRKTENKFTDVFIAKHLNFKESPNENVTKITKYLLNVRKWTESDFGEFLSESSSIKPLVWINSWMDYSNTYGFAYLLSNKNYGVNFNDDTRIQLQFNDQSIRYVKRTGLVFVYKNDAIPNTLRKKVKLLVDCGRFMNETLVQAHKGLVSEPAAVTADPPEEVIKWARTEGELVMCMTSGSIQVNFASDHTKLILCGSTKTVTVIERVNYMKTLKLDTLQKFGCSKQLKRKLFTVLKIITSLLSFENSEENRE